MVAAQTKHHRCCLIITAAPRQRFALFVGEETETQGGPSGHTASQVFLLQSLAGSLPLILLLPGGVSSYRGRLYFKFSHRLMRCKQDSGLMECLSKYQGHLKYTIYNLFILDYCRVQRSGILLAYCELIAIIVLINFYRALTMCQALCSPLHMSHLSAHGQSRLPFSSHF